MTSVSRNVDIIGNTAPSVPNAANSTWTVSGNKETGGGTHWTGGKSGSAIGNVEAEAAAPALSAEASDPLAPSLGADDGEVFRFSGNLERGTTKSGAALDFADGDTLVFANYDGGTFHAAAVTRPGPTSINSLADLRELDKASKDVSISANRKTDVLTIEIDQGDATHKVALADMAQEFLGL